MTSTQIDPAHIIADEAALRALFPPVHAIAAIKSLPALDRHARDFIARAPFVCLGTQGADGRADVSPRGDAPGFVQVLDDRRLALPDRPGNNRLDSLANIIGNPQVGLLFMIPGFDETLRVNGTAQLSTDPDLLALGRVDDRDPRLMVVVHVAEVFLHCAKAFRRSGLWDPAKHQDRSTMPSLMQMLHDQTAESPLDAAELAEKDAQLEEAYQKTLY
jgi:PPOX class probable FMN-dependent enzyme